MGSGPTTGGSNPSSPAKKIMEAKLSTAEVENLVNEADGHNRFNAANFVDELAGNRWNVPHSEHGWRRAAQEWGTIRGLVQEVDGYIALNSRGEEFKKACHERGVTIFSSSE